MHLNRKIRCLLCTITQTHSGNHVTLGCDTHTRTTTFSALRLDLLPEMNLCTLHLHRLRIIADFFQYLVDLLQFQIDDIIHQALGSLHMFLEQVEIEIGILCKRIDHITIEVDAQQTTGIVGTERNLSTGIRRYRTETEVGIAVGDTLTQDSVPEQDTRLGTLPGIMHNLRP